MPESSQKSDFRQPLVAYAARILSARPYFASQLRSKLLLRAEKLKFSAPETVVESIVADLASSGYLNDKYLTEAYIRRQLNKGYGPKIISLKLRQLGLDREVLSQALKSEASREAEILSIKHFCRKFPRLDKRKLISKLYSRGYSGATIAVVFDGDWLED